MLQAMRLQSYLEGGRGLCLAMHLDDLFDPSLWRASAYWLSISCPAALSLDFKTDRRGTKDMSGLDEFSLYARDDFELLVIADGMEVLGDLFCVGQGVRRRCGRPCPMKVFFINESCVSLLDVPRIPQLAVRQVGGSGSGGNRSG